MMPRERRQLLTVRRLVAFDVLARVGGAPSLPVGSSQEFTVGWLDIFRQRLRAVPPRGPSSPAVVVPLPTAAARCLLPLHASQRGGMSITTEASFGTGNLAKAFDKRGLQYEARVAPLGRAGDPRHLGGRRSRRRLRRPRSSPSRRLPRSEVAPWAVAPLRRNHHPCRLQRGSSSAAAAAAAPKLPGGSAGATAHEHAA